MVVKRHFSGKTLHFHRNCGSIWGLVNEEPPAWIYWFACYLPKFLDLRMWCHRGLESSWPPTSFPGTLLQLGQISRKIQNAPVVSSLELSLKQHNGTIKVCFQFVCRIDIFKIESWTAYQHWIAQGSLNCMWSLLFPLRYIWVVLASFSFSLGAC